jgi:hypothetical protein
VRGVYIHTYIHTYSSYYDVLLRGVLCGIYVCSGRPAGRLASQLLNSANYIQLKVP